MPKTRKIFDVLDTQDEERIHNASVELLWDVGIKIMSREGKELLLDNGCVDRGNGLIGIPWELVDKAVSANKPLTLYGQTPDKDIHLLRGDVYAHNFGATAAIIDIETGVKRAPTLEDQINTFRILEKMDNMHMIGPLVSATDVDPRLTQIVTVATAMQNSTKPFYLTVIDAQQSRSVAKIINASNHKEAKRRGIIMVSPVSPLTFNEECFGAIKELASAGLCMISLPCPYLGITTPLALAAGVAQVSAENLAFLVLAKLINPDTPVVYGCRLGFANLHTCDYNDGKPEKGFLGAAAAQMARRYNMASDVYGMATGASWSNDIQTGYDKALGGLQAVFAGADFMSGTGHLSHGAMTSYEQLVIDNEIVGMILKVVEGISVTDETLAVDVIKDAMQSDEMIVTHEHTVERLRSNDVFPGKLDNSLQYDKWVELGKPSVYENAKNVVRQILSSPDDVPEDKNVTQAFNEVVKELGCTFNGDLKVRT